MSSNYLNNYIHYQKDDIKKIISSLVVAVTGKSDIEIIIASGETRAVADKLYLSELKSFTQSDITLWRGYIDRALFKIAYHNVIIEKKYRPLQSKASLLYTYLMRLRYEIIGINNFLGSLINLKAVYKQHDIDWHSPEGYGLSYAIDYLCPNLKDNNTENSIPHNAKIISHLKKLHKSLHNNTDYAKNAAKFALFICDDSDNSHNLDNQNLSVDSYYNQSLENQSDNTIETDNQSQDTINCDDDSQNTLDFIDNDDDTSDMQNVLNQSDNFKAGIFVKEDFINDNTFDLMYQKTDYKIYKTDYDLEIKAEKLVHEKELQQLIKEFSIAQKTQVKTIQKLARKLRSRLVSVQNDCSYHDLYAGILDHAKIPKILSDPLDGRFFKDAIPIIAENTAVTLLIDNSGSMRGKPITMAALCADIIAETVERCGAKVEILGFTTQGWRGGLSRKDYEKAGCPPMPGRLNDLYHIIYKDFNASYKSTKRSIPVMLKESLLKENIDGEALQWAVQRLSQRPEPRKILTVISDGAPVDDSTNSANSSYYLENHLKKVIHYYENKSDIDVFAIGIGHDVKNYYKKAVTIANSDALAEALTERFVTLF